MKFKCKSLHLKFPVNYKKDTDSVLLELDKIQF